MPSFFLLGTDARRAHSAFARRMREVFLPGGMPHGTTEES